MGPELNVHTLENNHSTFRSYVFFLGVFSFAIFYIKKIIDLKDVKKIIWPCQFSAINIGKIYKKDFNVQNKNNLIFFVWIKNFMRGRKQIAPLKS